MVIIIVSVVDWNKTDTTHIYNVGGEVNLATLVIDLFFSATLIE